MKLIKIFNSEIEVKMLSQQKLCIIGKHFAMPALIFDILSHIYLSIKMCNCTYAILLTWESSYMCYVV
jgi:hypothetical protein